MPDHAEVGIILAAILQHWSAALNPLSRFRNPTARTFFSQRAQVRTVCKQLSKEGVCGRAVKLKIRSSSRSTGRTS